MRCLSSYDNSSRAGNDARRTSAAGEGREVVRGQVARDSGSVTSDGRGMDARIEHIRGIEITAGGHAEYTTTYRVTTGYTRSSKRMHGVYSRTPGVRGEGAIDERLRLYV